MFSAKRLSIRAIASLCVGAVVLTLFAACGQSAAPASQTSSADTAAASGDVTTAAVTDVLDGVKFDGRSFRVQMSATSISSNALMESPEETTGDVVNDAVFERNLTVSENLGVTFAYTETDYNWDKVADQTRTLVLAGDDAFDLIVNDQRGLSTSAAEGMLINVCNCKYFDFSQSCWWDAYMQDLTVGKNKMYLLVGDYFIDVLRKSHVIYYNRTLFNNLFGDPDAVYQQVLDKKWTYDQLNTYITGCYSDLDGDGKKNAADQYGMIIAGIGGSIFPYEYAADPDFISRDADNIPSITILNDRSDEMYAKIYEIFYNDATYTKYDENTQKLYDKFISGTALFESTVTIGTFENFRDMDGIGILPYPLLNDQQDHYCTTIHDTAEIGAIPLTCADSDFASAVTQSLNEESTKTLIPAYYETALKIKYVQDDYGAQMIDIVHNGITGLFPLIYGGEYADDIFTWAFLEPLQKKQESWVSSYQSRIEKATTQFQSLIDAYAALK